jgi:hypothetical protein
MSDSAVQTAASAWRAPLPHEWDTSDRVPEMAPAEISFGELLSSLNPLQHIPVVGSIYREITGETLHPIARVIGGALIGGPLGLVASAFNSMIEQATGKDLGAQALALILPDSKAQPAATAVASAEPKPAEPAEPAATVATAAPLPAEPEATAAATPTPMWPTPVADLAAIAPAAAAATKTAGDTAKAAAPSGEPQGRSLAYYQNRAGQRLPNVGNMTSQRTAMTATPNPTLQRQPLAAPAAAPAPTQARAADPVADAANEPADVWFAHAMMQGLDRYRETKRTQRSEPTVDVTR